MARPDATGLPDRRLRALLRAQRKRPVHHDKRRSSAVRKVSGGCRFLNQERGIGMNTIEITPRTIEPPDPAHPR